MNHQPGSIHRRTPTDQVGRAPYKEDVGCMEDRTAYSLGR